MAEKSQNIFIKQSAQEIRASYSDTLMKAENTSKLAMMSSGPTRRAMRVRTKSFEFFLLTNRHSVLSTDIREPSHHTKRTIPRWCSYDSSIPPSAASAGFCPNTTSKPWDSHQGNSSVFFVLLRKTWPEKRRANTASPTNVETCTSDSQGAQLKKENIADTSVSTNQRSLQS
jgi:hypothetical protein